jgi:hypothetical protein
MRKLLTATLGLAAFFTLVLAPQAARAGDKCGNPAICQYEEQIPTSGGSKVVGTGGGKKVAHVPASIVKSLVDQTGSQATAQHLLELATSSGAAPAKIKTTKAERTRIDKAITGTEAKPARPVAAGFAAVSGDGGNGRLLALVIVMGVMTAAALALAAVRRRGARPPRR